MSKKRANRILIKLSGESLIGENNYGIELDTVNRILKDLRSLKKYKNAKRYKNISYKKYLSKNLRVLDSAALSISRDNEIPIKIFSIKRKNCFKSVYNDKEKYSVIGNVWSN